MDDIFILPFYRPEVKDDETGDYDSFLKSLKYNFRKLF